MKTMVLLGFVMLSMGVRAQHLKSAAGHENNPYYSNTDIKHLYVTNAEWKNILSPALYATAREAATEKAFTGQYWNQNAKGTYYCAVCGNLLFRSDAKFSSTCGWPSFFEPVRKNSVVYRADNSYGMRRIEIRCTTCDAHLFELEMKLENALFWSARPSWGPQAAIPSQKCFGSLAPSGR